jgi:hypothetical protein
MTETKPRVVYALQIDDGARVTEIGSAPVDAFMCTMGDESRRSLFHDAVRDLVNKNEDDAKRAELKLAKAIFIFEGCKTVVECEWVDGDEICRKRKIKCNDD